MEEQKEERHRLVGNGRVREDDRGTSMSSNLQSSSKLAAIEEEKKAPQPQHENPSTRKKQQTLLAQHIKRRNQSQSGDSGALDADSAFFKGTL